MILAKYSMLNYSSLLLEIQKRKEKKKLKVQIWALKQLKAMRDYK